MSFQTIKAAIKTNMETITNVNNVQDFVLWTDDFQVIYSKFAKDGRIDFWQIQWESTPQNKFLEGVKERFFLINLFGIYSIKTANESSKEFEIVVEAIIDKFTEAPSFLAQTNNNPPTLVLMDNGVYIETPIHRAQIQMTVQERTAQRLKGKI